ncbi:flagellin, partial [bacterium]|nr:flagellin [bacterium]
MIVFIAMVLVAGIAASVLIHTSTRLESQAMSTGQETIAEVATGLAVFDIEGYASAVTANLSKIAITVRPRAGSAEIDLQTAVIELSDTNYKVVLKYRDATANNWWDEPTGYDDLFSTLVFPSDADDYGILVLEDADSSCSEDNPVINRGDKVVICITTSACFNINTSGTPPLGILERTEVWGSVVPEDGSPGVIAFRAPASFNDEVMDLQ